MKHWIDFERLIVIFILAVIFGMMLDVLGNQQKIMETQAELKELIADIETISITEDEAYKLGWLLAVDGDIERAKPYIEPLCRQLKVCQ